MQKIALLLIPLLFWGCDKTFENVIDVNRENYQVTSVSPTGNFVYNPNDSLITIRINFTSGSEVSDVSFDMIASDGSLLNSSPVPLFDNNDNRFYNQFPLSEYYPNGIYNLKYYVNEQTGSNALVAWGSFKYNNGQDNVAPVLSNLVIPDSVQKEQTFVFNVKAFDANGLSDIDIVFFDLFRPDTSRVTEGPFFMHDDGNLEVFGDSVAGDGIYSFKNSFAATAQTGNWRFVFQAKDRSDSLSNIIEHLMLVQ